jgi:RNA polymerase sigma factor (sigma-70 family)
MSEIDVYEILVREHEPMLLAYVYGLVHDHALAEDVCQEAFIQGYRKLPTLEKRDSFPAWLRAIARHAAFAALRQRSREPALQAGALAGMDDVFAALDRDPASASPAGATTWSERVGALRECFDLLPAQL